MPSSQFPLMAILAKDFLGVQYSVYHSLFLGVTFHYTVYPRLHRLAFVPRGAVGNCTPSLWLCSQIPNLVTAIQPTAHRNRSWCVRLGRGMRTEQMGHVGAVWIQPTSFRRKRVEELSMLSSQYQISKCPWRKKFRLYMPLQVKC